MESIRNLKGKLLVVVLTVALACVAGVRVAEAGGGLLNNSFGNGGKVMMDVSGTSDYVQAVVTQTDGRIVAVGSAGSSPLVARFNSDGHLDTSFGNGGKVFPAPLTIARGVALQPDGKILVAGSTPGSDTSGGLAVARLNSNGSFDTSFGNGSISPAQIFNHRGDYANAVVLQPDGRIVVAGIAGIAYRDSDFALARYNSDGSIDTSFGVGGKVNTSFGGGRDQAYSVVLQADGKIVVSGDASVSEYEVDFALARYNSNGTPDAAFDVDGKLTTRFFFENFARAYGVTIQPDGKIVAAGSAGVVGDYRFGLARYNAADGSVDTSFGTNGLVTLTFPGYARADVHSLALQADGKILLGGDAFSYGEDYNFALARFNSNGSLDSSFGTDGRVTTNFGAEDVAYAMSLQANGRILLAGQTGNYPNYDLALASYTNDFAPRRNAVADFDGDGTSDLSVFRPSAGTWFMSQSTAGFRAQAWGASGDVLVPADYDGDRKTDIAVFREGAWYILNSADNTMRAETFGQINDVPVAGDYDGDGKADPSVFRQGNWYMLQSTAGFRVQAWGFGTDKAVPADYDGDGKTDIAVFRNGAWYELQSSDGQLRTQAFGQNGDVLVAGDYDGDGRSDASVFRQGSWYVLQSSNGSFIAQQFGVATDRAAPADYDGDGRCDIAVFREGAWYILRSSNGSLRTEAFGASADVPVSMAVN